MMLKSRWVAEWVVDTCFASAPDHISPKCLGKSVLSNMGPGHMCTVWTKHWEKHALELAAFPSDLGVICDETPRPLWRSPLDVLGQKFLRPVGEWGMLH